ncbi:MAG TPA: alkaline phosphatase family protein, partial [Solirubrobacteraceae bacterium]|nr:alkaline phosphatase family protein [Solirubrobacteraceae bacterium]
AAAAFAAGSGGGLLDPARALARTTRHPDSLPDPRRAAGTATAVLPFDHLIVVMMENHSFDNLLGALPVSGQPLAHGLHFNTLGQATNSNPDATGHRVRAFPFPSTEQGPDVSQSWNATHEQIDGGRMDGFVRSVNNVQPMGYYPPAVVPFAYSLATTFCVGNRWFCSAPCQTYPNRRFLMAGTAYGNISTDNESLFDAPPPNGTIFDRLNTYGVSWKNYFTDLPQTGIIPSIIEKYPANLAPIAQFYADCATGTLPEVSYVDPEFGVLSDVGGPLSGVPGIEAITGKLNTTGGDEENPQDLAYGENWAYTILNAVLHSPAWTRTLLVYTYDEHGGYYDHVKPPPAIAPDSIAPALKEGDVPGGYDIYGPRVPAVVVSPYSKRNGVTNVLHDHTSVLATIEAKWNLPAMTYRDANATTVADFLNIGEAAFLSPPMLTAPPAPPVLAA